MSQKLIEYLVEQGLYFIPLHGIHNGKCTCVNPECTSQGKHPLFAFNWKIIATNDIEKITRWRERNKNLNFAIATGRKSSKTDKYLVVVDVDEKQHEIIKKLPTTFSYKTGGGGYHFWYWSKYPIKNSVSLVDINVDIRGKNGYVVIPPSKHISGEYKLLSSEVEPIVDLPKFLYESVFRTTKEEKPKRKTEKKAPSVLSEMAKNWSLLSVFNIKELIRNGNYIPIGVRNITCFRLLASERARGMLELASLTALGKEVRNYMEEPESFTDEEVEIIAKSVMKYPAYNNCHQKVNECYIKWLEKNGIKTDEHYRSTLNQLDDLFFTQHLKKTDGLKLGSLSLKEISDNRETWFKDNNLQTFSSYKPQLLAKKLEELGFKKIRTAKGNRWACVV